MDAVKYLKEAFRMCNTHDCEECPMKDVVYGFPCEIINEGIHIENIDECVSIVEEWAAKNPVKTRQSEFLKMFPNAEINDETGVIDLCPTILGEKMNCCENGIPRSCIECEKEYWLTEIKD